MAYNNSGELPIGQSYQLGEYVFSITVSHDPGESETGINVRCDKGGERARVASEVTGTVESWSVEANDSTADVYVDLNQSPVNVGGIDKPIPFASVASASKGGEYHEYRAPAVTLMWLNHGVYKVFASAEPDSYYEYYKDGTYQNRTKLATTYTHNGKKVYYYTENPYWGEPPAQLSLTMTGTNPNAAGIAWYMVYGDGTDVEKILVARFAIDIREADGGPDGDWDEPGDTGDPDYTLNVNVTGASAGTHDAAAVPLPPADQPVYGSGGAGGNGGGGGAGQSTVIVRRFATDKAGSVNQEVTLRPPGVGGKGGPGGKGGDGCILIFY